tara:strand:+ start:302 stop:427 length:126 start_codon:yes stop_codon:yes gene_type:complete
LDFKVIQARQGLKEISVLRVLSDFKEIQARQGLRENRVLRV